MKNLTPREAADELSAERWADERRERYAAAIETAIGEWETGEPTTLTLEERVADAAVAVADEEIQREWAGQQGIIARLRAELTEARADVRKARWARDQEAATIARIRSRHVEYEGATVSAGSECGYCFESWPCGTVEIINGEAEGEQ